MESGAMALADARQSPHKVPQHDRTDRVESTTKDQRDTPMTSKIRDHMEKGAAHLSPPSQAHLLEFPGETRNRIYCYALVQPAYVEKPTGTIFYGFDHFVEVTKDSYQAPGLLRTCKQTRCEASAIYYKENQFMPSPEEWDSTAGLSFYQHAGHYLTTEAPNVDWEGCYGGSSWYTWARRCHEGLLPWPSSGAFDMDNEEHGYIMFEMVKALKEVSWEKVKRILLTYEDGVRLGMESQGMPYSTAADR